MKWWNAIVQRLRIGWIRFVCHSKGHVSDFVVEETGLYLAPGPWSAPPPEPRPGVVYIEERIKFCAPPVGYQKGYFTCLRCGHKEPWTELMYPHHDVYVSRWARMNVGGRVIAEVRG